MVARGMEPSNLVFQFDPTVAQFNRQGWSSLVWQTGGAASTATVDSVLQPIAIVWADKSM